MSLKQLLRLSIVAQLAFAALAVAVDFAFHSWLPEPLRTYLEADAQAEPSVSDFVVLAAAVPLLVIGVVSLIGLWRFWWWSRPLYLFSWIGSWVLVPFLGPTVLLAVADTLWEVSAVFGGFTVGLIYCSDLRHAFTRSQAV